MWQKLLQLQFARDPRTVLQWMIEQGVGATLESYGISVEDALRGAGAGAVALTRFTNRLRAAIQGQPGHYQILGALRRAAYTDEGALLFVNAGLDPSRPIEAQSDSFWWNSADFRELAGPYGSFRRILRGFDPSHGGFAETPYTATLDGGCGFGGPLIAACVSADGSILERIEA
jgi:serine/threonine protein phosphatase 1